jgi:hypothetical protein
MALHSNVILVEKSFDSGNPTTCNHMCLTLTQLMPQPEAGMFSVWTLILQEMQYHMQQQGIMASASDQR